MGCSPRGHKESDNVVTEHILCGTPQDKREAHVLMLAEVTTPN